MTAPMLLIFFTLLFLGVPMAYAMGLSAVLAVIVASDLPLILLPQRFFSALDSFSLLAVPLYIFAGNLMNSAGITKSIVEFARVLIGHMRGGLAQVNILASILFAGISGSAAADTAAIGSMLIPAMKREGYSPQFSVVVTASSSIIGPIIPPSIIMVIYGSLTSVSIGALFLAGVIPGVLTGLVLMGITYFLAGKHGARPTLRRAPLSAIWPAFRSSLPALIMPGIIVLGILSGIFTATEAGAVAVAYGLMVAVLRREMSLSRLYSLVIASAEVTASALIVFGGASLFSWVLSRENIPDWALDKIFAVFPSPSTALLVIIVILLFMGLFLETVSSMIMIVPLLIPITNALGFDPIHIAMVTIIALLVGTITPPVGILALLACRIAGVSYQSTFRLLVPYIAVLIGLVFLLAYVPALTLWLPGILVR